MLFICQRLLFVKVMRSRHDMKWNVNFVWVAHCYVAKKRGWPHCRIYIYNYSHDTIISHHNPQDVNSNRDLAPHDAYQTAARLIASRPSNLHHARPHLRLPILSVTVSLPLCFFSLSRKLVHKMDQWNTTHLPSPIKRQNSKVWQKNVIWCPGCVVLRSSVSAE